MKSKIFSDFSSDDISERIGELYKNLNITSFADDNGLSRKTLYKMKANGIIPSGLLLLLCEEAEVNPVLVKYSKSERLVYFSLLAEYIRDSSAEDLYSDFINTAEKQENSKLKTSLEFVHQMYIEGDLTAEAYEKRIQQLLCGNQHVKE